MASKIRIKRRASGAAGAPEVLDNAELAFNEVDDVLYYGKGTGGEDGTATTVEAIGGRGAFLSLTGTQTVSGEKTFNALKVPEPLGDEYAVNKTYVDDAIEVQAQSSVISITTTTAAATAAKLVTIGGGFVLKANQFFSLKFTLGNTAASPTLNIDGLGATPIHLNGAAANATVATMAANASMMLYFDGTYFQMLGSQRTTDTDTTYAEITTAEIDAGSATTLRTITGQRARYIQDSRVGTATQSALDLKLDIAEVGVSVQPYSAVLSGTTASFTTAQETKLGHITVTASVDLDDLKSRVNDLDAAVVLKGAWSAAGSTFPGAGAAQAGWSYIVSTAGTVGGIDFNVNDRILALTDNASTSTYANNWLKLDYTDQVLSVAGKTGAVTLAIADVAGLQSSLDGKVGTGDSRLTDAREWTAATVTQAEAEAGTDTTRKAWTAQRVFQAITAWWNASAAKTKLDGIQAGAQVNTVTSVAGKTGAVTLAQADISGLTTASSPQFTGVNVGHASDTTVTRAAAGRIAVEGSNVLMASDVGTSVQAYSAVLQGTTASFTTAQQTKLSGIEAGAQVNVATNLGITTNATTAVVTSSTGTNATIPAATTSAAGTMTAADKTKLNGVETGAQVNTVTAVAGKTGAVSLGVSDISGLQTALDGKVGTGDSRLTDAREWTASTVDQAEAEAGSATTRRAWTAQRVRQAVLGWWNGSSAKTKLDGIETGAQVNTVTSVAGRTGAVTIAQADVAGLTTASSPQFAGINIGAATDTTVTRAAAGRIAVEGSNVLMASDIGTTVQAYSATLQGTTASFTSALLTKLNGIETGADVTDTANVTAAGALMDSEVDANIKTLALPADTTITAIGKAVVGCASDAHVRQAIGLGFDDDVSFLSVDATEFLSGPNLARMGSFGEEDPETLPDIEVPQSGIYSVNSSEALAVDEHSDLMLVYSATPSSNAITRAKMISVRPLIVKDEVEVVQPEMRYRSIQAGGFGGGTYDSGWITVRDTSNFVADTHYLTPDSTIDGGTF